MTHRCHDDAAELLKLTELGATGTNGTDTLESFLSKVAFRSNLRKKLARTEHVLIVKVYFERRKIAKVFTTRVQDFFRKSLLKATFRRKLSSVSLPLVTVFRTTSRDQTDL